MGSAVTTAGPVRLGVVFVATAVHDGGLLSMPNLKV